MLSSALLHTATCARTARLGWARRATDGVALLVGRLGPATSDCQCDCTDTACNGILTLRCQSQCKRLYAAKQLMQNNGHVVTSREGNFYLTSQRAKRASLAVIEYYGRIILHTRALGAQINQRSRRLDSALH
jgi:hypothetical protein